MLQKILFYVLLCGLPNSVLALEHWQEPDYLLSAFTTLAFKNEFDTQTVAVRKWRAPVQVWIKDSTENSALHRQLIEMHLQHLTQLSAHSVSLAAQAKQANVTVIMTTESQWAEQARRYLGEHALAHVTHTVCMAGFNVNASNEITHAVVIIPVDQAQRHRKLVSCIVEELTQVMGLPNDSEAIYPSVFNDKSKDDLLTGLDGLLLKLLYQPSIKAGMSLQETKKIAHKTLLQWQQDGTISRANQTVRQGALYPLMGYE